MICHVLSLNAKWPKWLIVAKTLSGNYEVNNCPFVLYDQNALVKIFGRDKKLFRPCSWDYNAGRTWWRILSLSKLIICVRQLKALRWQIDNFLTTWQPFDDPLGFVSRGSLTKCDKHCIISTSTPPHLLCFMHNFFAQTFDDPLGFVSRGSLTKCDQHCIISTSTPPHLLCFMHNFSQVLRSAEHAWSIDYTIARLLGTSHYLWPGGPEGKWYFTGRFFKAHLACGQNISRPTRHRTIIFRHPVLENTIDIIL